MPAIILSGLKARDAHIPGLQQKAKELLYVPKLAIIQVGDRPDSTSYIKAKKSFAAKIGVEIEHIHLAQDISQAEVIAYIEACNTDKKIQGIIVQVPLPGHIDRIAVIEAIDPSKDVDGLTSTNYGRLLAGNSTAIVPATARGIRELFSYYNISLAGKKVAVVGRSRLVGAPIAIVCKQAGAEVIVCHSQTPDLARETRQADVVIVAVGKPGLVGSGHIKKGAVVIDVGISKMADGTLVGDVDFEAVKEIASALTPVPGGVGPMTVLGLFENVVDACN